MSLSQKIKELFLSKENALSKKRTLKVGNLFIALIVFLFLFFIGGVFLQNPSIVKNNNFTNDINATISSPQISNSSNNYEEDKLPYDDIQTTATSPLKKKKKKVISQLINLKKKQNFIGAKVLVELQGNLKLSSQSEVPVRVKVIENLSGSFNLLENSILIGRGRIDTHTQRLQINFQQLINNSGEVKPIQASAFMPDGSFGIKGGYNSGELKKYGSRVAGNFIGGLSQGLKTKTQNKAGHFLELSSLKNALLSGLSLSALDYARSKASKHQNPTATMTILNETRFFVHF